MNHIPFPCALVLSAIAGASELPYPVVDTGQTTCYDNSRSIAPPPPGARFHGQDACYAGSQPAYRDNGDGTVEDLVTGLTWQQDNDGKVSRDEFDGPTPAFGHHDRNGDGFLSAEEFPKGPPPRR